MMNNKISFLITCLLLFLGTSYGQNITISWTSTLNCEWVQPDSVVIIKDMRIIDKICFPDTALSVKIDPTNIFDAVTSENNLKVYPNPAKATSNIEVNVESTQNVYIKVINLQGKIVSDMNCCMEAGIHQFNASISKTGCYIVLVQIGEKIYTKKYINMFAAHDNEIHYVGSKETLIPKQQKENSIVAKQGDKLAICCFLTDKDTILYLYQQITVATDTLIVFDFYDNNGIVENVEYQNIGYQSCVLWENIDLMYPSKASYYAPYYSEWSSVLVECVDNDILVISSQDQLDSLCKPNEAYNLPIIDFNNQIVVIFKLWSPYTVNKMTLEKVCKMCNGKYYIDINVVTGFYSGTGTGYYFVVLNRNINKDDVWVHVKFSLI